MLKISFSETPAEERWILHGLLTDPWYNSSGRAGRRATAPMCNVIASWTLTSHFIDKCGERLLRLLAKDGAKFTASGLYQTHS